MARNTFYSWPVSDHDITKLFADVSDARRQLSAFLASMQPSSPIYECASAFDNNICRADSIAELAVLSCGLTHMRWSFNNTIRQKAKDELVKDGELAGESDTRLSRLIFRNSYLNLAKLFKSPLNPDHRKNCGDYASRQIALWASIHPEMADGIHAVLASQITLAWTAFETLAGDLWEVFLNIRPRLGFMALDAWPVSDDRTEIQRKREAKIEIPRWLLEEPDFVALQCLGTVARQQQQWGFQKLNNIISAYGLVFGRDQSLMGILQDDRLRVVSAIRNVIVHKAGKADQQFIDQVGSDPDLRELDKGDPVPITNDRATKLLEAVCENGQKLLIFASDWLDTNPT
jgi:hypothetical protein